MKFSLFSLLLLPRIPFTVLFSNTLIFIFIIIIIIIIIIIETTSRRKKREGQLLYVRSTRHWYQHIPKLQGKD